MSRALTIVPNQPSSSEAKPSQRASAPQASVIDAQLAGQTGARRGLRGGQPVLEAARSAYLEAEWRGHDDRRLPTGALKRLSL